MCIVNDIIIMLRGARCGFSAMRAEPIALPQPPLTIPPLLLNIIIMKDYHGFFIYH